MCDLVEAFERLVVRKKPGFRTPKVAANALDAPDNAARFQIQRGPVRFRLDGGAADEHVGAKGVVVLFLFEGGTETIYTGIVVDEERAGVIGKGVSVGVDENRGRVLKTKVRTLCTPGQVCLLL